MICPDLGIRPTTNASTRSHLTDHVLQALSSCSQIGAVSDDLLKKITPDLTLVGHIAGKEAKNTV